MTLFMHIFILCVLLFFLFVHDRFSLDSFSPPVPFNQAPASHLFYLLLGLSLLSPGFLRFSSAAKPIYAHPPRPVQIISCCIFFLFHYKAFFSSQPDPTALSPVGSGSKIPIMSWFAVGTRALLQQRFWKLFSNDCGIVGRVVMLQTKSYEFGSSFLMPLGKVINPKSPSDLHVGEWIGPRFWAVVMTTKVKYKFRRLSS